ncbi:MAG: RluA family pseudouridine synthase [Planctomycetota bacterium]|nr:MAG: RluA family pseudouridine synthase [Planctomycetota bacterium]
MQNRHASIGAFRRHAGRCSPLAPGKLPRGWPARASRHPGMPSTKAGTEEGPCRADPLPDPVAPMPFVAELIVEPYLSGKRIDTFLSRHFRNYNTWRLMRLVRVGAVTVDGLRATCDQRVWRGQHVRVILYEPPDKLLAAEPQPLDILYEDPWLLVVNKPVDQVAHPAGEIHGGTLANAAQWHLDRQTRCRSLLRPGIVHRLDRFTSGVVVLTKDHLSHRRIQQQFEHRRVRKSYLALVRGVVAPDTLTIDLPIGAARHPRWKLMSASPQARAARPAITHVRVVRRFQEATLVEAVPWTGRLHQIRVHLAFVGHPVLCDEFYAEWGALKGVPAHRSERYPSRNPAPCPHARSAPPSVQTGVAPPTSATTGTGPEAPTSVTPAAMPMSLPAAPYVLVQRPGVTTSRRSCDRFDPGGAIGRLHRAARYPDATRRVVVSVGERPLHVFGPLPKSRELFGVPVPQWDRATPSKASSGPHRRRSASDIENDSRTLEPTRGATRSASTPAVDRDEAAPSSVTSEDASSHGGTNAERWVAPFLDRQALHAFQLVFSHPITEVTLSFRAPLPADMCAALVLLD